MFIKFLLCVILFSYHSLADELVRQIPSKPQLSFSPLIKKVSPAVVNIYTKKKQKIHSFSPFLNDPFLQHFFGSHIPDQLVNSLGSGVIVAKDGLIVTNNHVVKDSEEITVILADRRQFSAKISKASAKYDLALLKIDCADCNLPYLELADSNKLEVGDLVLAIGNPFGVGQSVTNGIISAPIRSPGGNGDQFFIQTDAAINQGNSGGGLIDMQGKLIGINTAIFSTSGGSQGIGFATPANIVSYFIEQTNTQTTGKWSGIIVSDINKDIAESINLPTISGVIIKNIYPQSPASNAGLQIGDIITKINDRIIDNQASFKFYLLTNKPSSPVILTILRQNKLQVKELILANAIEIPKRDLRKMVGKMPLSGALIANLSPALAEEMSIDVTQGVIVGQVDENSYASYYGFSPKDIIISLNDKKIISTKQLSELVKITDHWRFVINRSNELIEFSVN